MVSTKEIPKTAAIRITEMTTQKHPFPGYGYLRDHFNKIVNRKVNPGASLKICNFEDHQLWSFFQEKWSYTFAGLVMTISR
jgi:hypothetical protein